MLAQKFQPNFIAMIITFFFFLIPPLFFLQPKPTISWKGRHCYPHLNRRKQKEAQKEAKSGSL